MKYIDAELLRKEIERQLSAHDKVDHLEAFEVGKAWNRGHRQALKNILSFIDSLQQEQPDFPTTDEQVKEFLAAHPEIKVPEKYKNPDWLWKRQEQPDEHYTKRNELFDQCVANCAPEVMKEVSDKVDIENEIDACWQNWLSPSNQKEVEGVLPKTEFAMYARHFYELGKAANPKVMQDVSDNVDKLRAISTPAEEDWFKVAEEWEKEDEK